MFNGYFLGYKICEAQISKLITEINFKTHSRFLTQIDFLTHEISDLKNARLQEIMQKPLKFKEFFLTFPKKSEYIT